MFYILKEYAFFYTGGYELGHSIDRCTHNCVCVYRDKEAALKEWVKHEREYLEDVARTDYDIEGGWEEYEEVLKKLGEKLNRQWDSLLDLQGEIEEQGTEILDQLSDNDLLEVLQMINGNRFLVEEISEEDLHRKRYCVIRAFDNDFDEDDERYEGYCVGGAYIQNFICTEKEDRDVFFKVELFNEIMSEAWDGKLFMGCSLTEQDRANAELQDILKRFEHVFNVNWDEGFIQFRSQDWKYKYTQEDIDALHQVNALLQKPFFKIEEYSYANQLV